MRLDQLRQFVAVAKTGNFRKAGRELGISQPALTRSIQSLEQYFGVRLFDRLPGGVILTEYGKYVKDWAEETIDSSRNIKRYVDLLNEASTGTLAVGTGTYFADSVLASALSTVLSNYPTLRIKVVRDTGQNAENMILNRQIDLFLGWIEPLLKADTIYTERFDLGAIALFCRKGHPLMNIYKPDLGVIFKYPFVGPVIPESVQAKADRVRQNYTDTDRPLIDLEFDSYSQIRRIVEISDCVAGLPLSSMLPFFEKGMFERLPHDLPGVTAVSAISFLKGRTLLPAAQYLINELKLLMLDR